jgi:signal transduction histidine kinase
MNLRRPTILIISAGPARQRCLQELNRCGNGLHVLAADSIAHSRTLLLRHPDVVFLDEFAVAFGSEDESLESAATWLCTSTPVVVAAEHVKKEALRSLIAAGRLDFVERSGDYLARVAQLLVRRARTKDLITSTIEFPRASGDDFGEILRHEVNNPLTGILGNTELLLAQRDRLPAAAVERLQTIAELAVRLRETIRRLSNAWEESNEHARPA